MNSRKDQEQYWADRSKPYRYMTVTEFVKRFKEFHVGLELKKDLSVPFDKTKGHRAALVFEKHSVAKIQLLKACWGKEWLLIRRNSFIYIFKSCQIIILAVITATVFFRTTMHQNDENDGTVYVGPIMFSMLNNMFSGFGELGLIMQRLPVFYRQRDMLFHPVWAYTLPNFLLSFPRMVLETVIWVAITYYTVGYAPEVSR